MGKVFQRNGKAKCDSEFNKEEPLSKARTLAFIPMSSYWGVIKWWCTKRTCKNWKCKNFVQIPILHSIWAPGEYFPYYFFSQDFFFIWNFLHDISAKFHKIFSMRMHHLYLINALEYAWFGVRVQNMKIDFNTRGTWRRVGQWMLANDENLWFFYSAYSLSSNKK